MSRRSASPSQPWIPHTATVFFMTFLYYLFGSSPTVCLSKAYSILQAQCKPHLLHKGFPNIYDKNELLSPACSQSAFVVFLFSHWAPNASCLVWHFCISLSPLINSLRTDKTSHSYMYPQKQWSRCLMQSWSSVNVCWLEVWFCLLYPLALLGTAWAVTMTVSKRQLQPSRLSALVLSVFMMCFHIVSGLCQKPSTLVIHFQSG